jgi:hypothetical protein
MAYSMVLMPRATLPLSATVALVIESLVRRAHFRVAGV